VVEVLEAKKWQAKKLKVVKGVTMIFLLTRQHGDKTMNRNTRGVSACMFVELGCQRWLRCCMSTSIADALKLDILAKNCLV
jgi:hypothetical protein